MRTQPLQKQAHTVCSQVNHASTFKPKATPSRHRVHYVAMNIGAWTDLMKYMRKEYFLDKPITWASYDAHLQ